MQSTTTMPAEGGTKATTKARRPRVATSTARVNNLTAGGSRTRSIAIACLWIALGLCVGGGAMWMRNRAREREVVVSVNGDVITKDVFYHRLEQAAGEQVIRQMVGEALQVQYAKREKSAPTDEDIARRYREVSRQQGFSQELVRTRRTPDDVKRELRVALCRINTLGKGVTVSDEEIRRYYDANVDPRNPQARYYQPETAQLAVIVMPTEDEAKKALADLHHGIPWATVAKTRSHDATKANGGLMPPLVRGRSNARRYAGFEETIFGMKIGETIGPRRFGGAWWLIRVLDRTAAATQPYEKVKDEARMGATLTKAIPGSSARVQAEFERFQKSAAINAFWVQYRDTVSAQ
jgi:foldase protein PrsA